MMLLQLLIVVVLCNQVLSFKFYRHKSFMPKKSLVLSATEESVDSEGKLNPREERKRIGQSEKYNRMGFQEEKAAVKGLMNSEFTSSLIADMRANKNTITRGDITVKLAENFGFCWGVERAIAIAYQARAHFPDNRIFITNEIIHNPEVNERLHEMNVKFLPKIPTASGTHGESNKDFSEVQEGDVVILPAFGATIQEMQLLEKMGVQIVDTTCPWVSKVWNAVDKHRKAHQTSVIHGKYSHEESIATASFCDDYIIIKDLEEAEYVTNYIVNGGDKEEFMRKFAKATSKGFDPDKHLEKVGLANQTTMYKRETKEIGRIFEVAMLKKFGPQNLAEHYAEFDTICDATQERQDAVTELVADKSIDMLLVVGGFDSSNTAHLNEIAEKYHVLSYHIDRATRIGADNSIEHRLVNGDVMKTPQFLRPGPLTIGLTSGASTPDRALEDALERIFMIHKLL